MSSPLQIARTQDRQLFLLPDMAKSAARQVTNQIVRGVLGSLMGGRRR